MFSWDFYLNASESARNNIIISAALRVVRGAWSGQMLQLRAKGVFFRLPKCSPLMKPDFFYIEIDHNDWKHHIPKGRMKGHFKEHGAEQVILARYLEGTIIRWPNTRLTLVSGVMESVAVVSHVSNEKKGVDAPRTSTLQTSPQVMLTVLRGSKVFFTFFSPTQIFGANGRRRIGWDWKRKSLELIYIYAVRSWVHSDGTLFWLCFMHEHSRLPSEGLKRSRST